MLWNVDNGMCLFLLVGCSLVESRMVDFNQYISIKNIYVYKTNTKDQRCGCEILGVSHRTKHKRHCTYLHTLSLLRRSVIRIKYMSMVVVDTYIGATESEHKFSKSNFKSREYSSAASATVTVNLSLVSKIHRRHAHRQLGEYSDRNRIFFLPQSRLRLFFCCCCYCRSARSVRIRVVICATWSKEIKVQCGLVVVILGRRRMRKMMLPGLKRCLFTPPSVIFSLRHA
jgi:hypothetical protein